MAWHFACMSDHRILKHDYFWIGKQPHLQREDGEM